MSVAVVDWNVNGFAGNDQVAFLDRLDWDIALLQEGTRDTWPPGAGWQGTAVRNCGPSPAWCKPARRPRAACCVTCHPERAIVASVEVDGRRLAACS